MDPLNPFGQPQGGPLFPWMQPRSKNDLLWDQAVPAKLVDEAGGPGQGRDMGKGAPVMIGDPTGGPATMAFENPGQRKPKEGADAPNLAAPPADFGTSKPYSSFPSIDGKTGTPAMTPPGAMPSLALPSASAPSMFEADKKWFDSKAATAPAGTQIPTRPGSMEDYIAKITGVAYGQAPMQFDPNLRASALTAALHEYDQGLGSQDKQAMGNFGLAGKAYESGLDNASKERIAAGTNATHLRVAEMNDPRNTMRADMLLKLGLLKAQDPNLDLERVVRGMHGLTGLIDETMPNALPRNIDPTPGRPGLPPLLPGLPGSQPQGAPTPPGVEKGLSGAPSANPAGLPPVGATVPPGIPGANPLAGAPGVLDARDRARTDIVNLLRTGFGKQGAKGYELDPTKLNEGQFEQTLATVAPLLKNADPAVKADLVRMLQSGEALGDVGPLRRGLAPYLATQQLAGGGTPFKDGQAASSYKVGGDNGQPLFELRRNDPTFLGKMMETVGAPVLGRSSQVPYNELVLPGGETVPFSRGGVTGLGRTFSNEQQFKKKAAERMAAGTPLYQLLFPQGVK